MLLFPWGIYDRGTGLSFEFDMTRQFIVETASDDDAIWQLSLTLHYDPPHRAAPIGRSNHWRLRPDGVEELRRFVWESAALAYAESRSPRRVEVDLQLAG